MQILLSLVIENDYFYVLFDDIFTVHNLDNLNSFIFYFILFFFRIQFEIFTNIDFCHYSSFV